MPDDYQSLCDFYRQGPYAGLPQSHGALVVPPIKLMRVEQPSGAFPDAPTPDLVVQLYTGGPATARIDVGGGAFTARARRGALLVTPPRTATSFEFDRPNGFLAVSLDTAAASDVVSAALGRAVETLDFGRLHSGYVFDDFAEQLCSRLWTEAVDGGRRGRLFTEAAQIALLTHLLALAAERPTPAKGDLSARRLRRATDYIEAHLHEDLSLADLAAAAGLSSAHFARGFKHATGQTPHRHVLERRVERARGLLRETALPIAEVALACGFAGQSHLGEAFRKLVGTSPGAYRRGV